MNDARSSESCRIVSVSPCPPNSTSWCATSPATRTLCTRTVSTVAPRAPGTSLAVASGGAARPASARAAPMMFAVRKAVPDGASILAAWCSSMTSADSKNRAASAANRIMRIAPMEKFGTTSTRTLAAASQPRTSASRSSSNPEVPTTTSRLCSTHHLRLPMTAPGWVKSSTTSQPASAPRSSSWSTSAETSRSGASAIAAHAVRPIRPRAPSTPTFVTAQGYRGARANSRRWQVCDLASEVGQQILCLVVQLGQLAAAGEDHVLVLDPARAAERAGRVISHFVQDFGAEHNQFRQWPLALQLRDGHGGQHPDLFAVLVPPAKQMHFPLQVRSDRVLGHAYPAPQERGFLIVRAAGDVTGVVAQQPQRAIPVPFGHGFPARRSRLAEVLHSLKFPEHVGDPVEIGPEFLITGQVKLMAR